MDGLVEAGGHDGQAVQDDGELGLVPTALGLRVLSALRTGGTRLVAVGQQPLGQLGELLGAVRVEGQRDDPLLGGLSSRVGLQARVGALELGAGDLGRAEDVGALVLGAGLLGAGDDGDLGVLRLTGEVLRVGAVGHVAVVEELLGDPGVRRVRLVLSGERVGGDDPVLVDIRQLLGDLLGSPGLCRRLSRGLRGGSRGRGRLLAVARALLGALGVRRRLSRLAAGTRAGLSRLRRGRPTRGVLAGDVLGGLLGAARKDAQDRAEVHDGRGTHQLQGGLAGLTGQRDHDVLTALAGDLRLGDTGGVHALADHLDGLLDVVVTDRRAIGGGGRQDELGPALQIEGEAGGERGLVPHASRHERTETDDKDEDEHQEAAPWALSLLTGHVVPSWSGVCSSTWPEG